MRTAYIIGNGTRSDEQIQYIKERRHESLIIAINHAIKEWPDWGFEPHIAGDLEMEHDHATCPHWIRLMPFLNYNHKTLKKIMAQKPQHQTEVEKIKRTVREHPDLTKFIQKRFFINEALKYPNVRFYFSHWIEKYVDTHPNLHFLPIIPFDPNHPGKCASKGIIKFGDSGNAFTYHALQNEKCNKVILIGMNGFRTEEEANLCGFNFKKNNQIQQNNWLKLNKWNYLNGNKPILNASLETKIKCFQKIKI